MRMTPIGSLIGMLGPPLVDIFGNGGLVGGDISLGINFEVSKAHSTLSSPPPFCLMLADQIKALSCGSSRFLLAAMMVKGSSSETASPH